MTLHYTDDRVSLYHGDCIEVMRQLPDASVDAVVTDPPYGLEFMGKDWDKFKTGRSTKYASGGSLNHTDFKNMGTLPSYTNRPAKRCAICGKQAWSGSPCKCAEPQWSMDNSPLLSFQAWFTEVATEALRVLKPGGHLLAFGGTRTWHRLAVAIEDAGFEVRDSMAWLYGSGFPKSLDVSKAIDKRRDDYPAIKNLVMFIREALSQSDKTRNDLERALGGSAVAAHFLAPSRTNASCPNWEQWQTLKSLLQFDDSMDAEVWRLNGRKGKPGEAWELRPVTGTHEQSTAQQVWMQNYSDHVALPPKERKDIPATPAAEQWQGWGTALKPAFEPIVVARKPLIGTVAENVLTHGTGALNIDGCRIGMSEQDRARVDGRIWVGRNQYKDGKEIYNDYATDGTDQQMQTHPAGRWPANVILDESQAAELDKQSGVQKDGTAMGRPNASSGYNGGWGAMPDVVHGFGGQGGASRFFYVAKASKKERPNVNGVAHPTVKPMALMRYLVRLVTPPGGTVLEPFAGSGTTIEAALEEGFNVIGIEMTDEYLPLILARIERYGDKLC